FDVGRHVRFTDQHIAHADLLEVIAERRLADTQRPAIPVRTVRAHVAPSIERHARWAADRRLHIGVGEADAALCHRIDIGCLNCGMAIAAEVIIAKLVAHDPDDVLRSRHQASSSLCVPDSVSAVPFALSLTGVSPITSTSARSASLTPWPVAPDNRSGVFLVARFSRSFCFFSSSGATASILFRATISIFSAR